MTNQNVQQQRRFNPVSALIVVIALALLGLSVWIIMQMGLPPITGSNPEPTFESGLRSTLVAPDRLSVANGIATQGLPTVTPQATEVAAIVPENTPDTGNNQGGGIATQVGQPIQGNQQVVIDPAQLEALLLPQGTPPPINEIFSASDFGLSDADYDLLLDLNTTSLLSGGLRYEFQSLILLETGGQTIEVDFTGRGILGGNPNNASPQFQLYTNGVAKIPAAIDQNGNVITQDLPFILEIIWVDEVLYLKGDGPTDTTGWASVTQEQLFNASDLGIGGMGANPLIPFDVTGAGGNPLQGIDPNTAAQFANTELLVGLIAQFPIANYVSIQRGPNQQVNGEETASFDWTIDVAGLLNSPEIQQFTQLAAMSQGLPVQQSTAGLLERAELLFSQYYSLNNSVLRRLTVNTFIQPPSISAQDPTTGQLVNQTLTIDVTYQLDLFDHGQNFPITPPDNAQPIQLP